MDNSDVNLSGSDMQVARNVSSASLALGLLLTVLGTFSVMAPLFTGLAVTTLVGILLGTGGMVQVIFAFQSETFGKGAFRFVAGVLSLIAGMIILASPGEGLGVLTILLTGFFLASGLVDIVLSFKVPAGEGKGWMLFNGIVTIAFAALILSQWPVSGIWAVGLLVGVRLMLYGMMLMVLGNTGKKALTQLQDTRIAEVEQHLRSGAQALHLTQITLADHAAMLLALDNELRKKVSSSEIDPAIVELNKSLSKARDQVKEAAAVAKENWAKTQEGASAVFDKLQQNTAKISKRLKAELGLDKEEPSSDDSNQ